MTGIGSLPAQNQFAAFEAHLRELVAILARRHAGMTLEQVPEKPDVLVPDFRPELSAIHSTHTGQIASPGKEFALMGSMTVRTSVTLVLRVRTGTSLCSRS